MSFGSGLFRDRALKQGDVREALDERVRIVGVPRWIALGVAVLIILGIIAWSASKDIQSTVQGTGIISSRDGVPVVASPVSGTVVTAPPTAGTAVRRGEVLAVVDPGQGPPVRVRSLFAGTIQDVNVAVGAFINVGTEIAVIEPASGTPVAFLFVPASQAQQLRVGMQALLSPSLSQSRATELLKGRVQEVSPYPATPAQLTLILGPDLGPLFEHGPAVQEVEVGLVRDPSTPSGYAWTDGKGPRDVEIGTPLSGRFVVSQSSPLSHIF